MICDPLLAISPQAGMEKSGLHDLHSLAPIVTEWIAHGSLEHVLSMLTIVHAIRMDREHAGMGSAIDNQVLPPLNMVAIIANHTARTTIHALIALPLLIGVRMILMRVVPMIAVTIQRAQTDRIGTRTDELMRAVPMIAATIQRVHTDRIGTRTGESTNSVRIMRGVIKVEAISSAILNGTTKETVIIDSAILNGTTKGAVIISRETRGTRIRAGRVVLDFNANMGRADKRLMSILRKKMSNLRVITSAIMHLDILKVDFRGMRVGVNTESRNERSDMLLACRMGVFLKGLDLHSAKMRDFGRMLLMIQKSCFLQ